MKQFTLRLSDEQFALLIEYKGRVLSSTKENYTNSELVWLLLRHGIHNLPPSEVGEKVVLEENTGRIGAREG